MYQFVQGGGGPLLTGFTMAEILLSLTIIGVVAAITLPALTGNINERTWNTQRKALYARMSQAIVLMPALNGYGTLTEDENHSVTADTAAETFITEGLSKVLKINNICDSEHIEDCGIVAKLTTINGSIIDTPTTLKDLNVNLVSVSWAYANGTFAQSYSAINTKVAAFETANGESIIAYYNPKCQSYMGEFEYIIWPKLCVNFVYDLNGNKGPNTMGKDIGVISVFYPVDSSVVLLQEMKTNGNGTWSQAVESCRNLGDEYRLPNNDELAAYIINKKLIRNVYTSWSSTMYSGGRPYYMWDIGFLQTFGSKTAGSASANCIKR